MSSEDHVGLKDVRRHADWLLHQLADSVEELRAAGCRTAVFCYWLSGSGHGGPMLSPGTMNRLSRANPETGFDVYPIRSRA